MLRTLFFCIFLAVSALGIPFSAGATTYDINLDNPPPGVPGTGGTLFYTGPCYCDGITAFYSQVYLFQPGSVVDFGHLDIFNHDYGQSTPDAGPTQPNLYISGFTNVNFGPDLFGSVQPPGLSGPFPNFSQCNFDDATCNTEAQNSVISADLIYIVPPGADSIQVMWDAVDFTYTPPAPELSTWAMLLIGFAAIGFVGYRKRQKLHATFTLSDTSPPPARRHYCLSR